MISRHPSAPPARPCFRYCPHCGESTNITDDGRKFVCLSCAYCYFHNVAAAAAALIVHHDTVLSVRRAEEPWAGTLDLPGGFIEPGESAEQALRRELAEEIHLHELPGVPRFLCSFPNAYAYGGMIYATCDLFFLIECDTRPQLAPNQEVDGLSWLTLATLDPKEFGMRSVRQALRRVRET
jgi:NAD+ diphosphatase